MVVVNVLPIQHGCDRCNINGCLIGIVWLAMVCCLYIVVDVGVLSVESGSLVIVIGVWLMECDCYGCVVDRVCLLWVCGLLSMSVMGVWFVKYDCYRCVIDAL